MIALSLGPISMVFRGRTADLPPPPLVSLKTAPVPRATRPHIPHPDMQTPTTGGPNGRAILSPVPERLI